MCFKRSIPLLRLRVAMTYEDLDYIRKLIGLGLVRSPTLEVGGGAGGTSEFECFAKAGIDYQTANLEPGPRVHYVADFETDACLSAVPHREFGTVLVPNILEHVFEPIRVLDHAVALT